MGAAVAGLTFEITRRALLGGIGTLTLAKVATTTSTDGLVTNKETSKGGDPNVPTYPQRKVTSYLLFDDVANVNIPESLSEFRTVGYHTQGVGAGLYRADSNLLSIADDHPQFCAISRNGRKFMLVPEGGSISVEQAGAVGDNARNGLVNDRIPFQAAIDYARATRIPRIELKQPAYAIWMTSRSTPAFMWGTDGNGLIIHDDQRILIVGTASERSLLLFRGPRVESFASGSATQSVLLQSWRGNGIVLRTNPTVSYSGLALQHLRIETDYRRNPNGSAVELEWDVTNKGIMTEPDKLGGDISIVDCAFAGWRGETVYGNNDPQRTLYVRQSTFSDSNGQGLNPNSLQVDVADCRISNCNMGIEG